MPTLLPTAALSRLEEYLETMSPDEANPIETYLRRAIEEVKRNPQAVEIRHRKVFYLSQPRAGGCSDVPWISLAGRWVSKLGFATGYYMHIFGLKGVIVICLDQKDAHAQEIAARREAELEQKRIARKRSHIY